MMALYSQKGENQGLSEYLLKTREITETNSIFQLPSFSKWGLLPEFFPLRAAPYGMGTQLVSPHYVITLEYVHFSVPTCILCSVHNGHFTYETYCNDGL